MNFRYFLFFFILLTAAHADVPMPGVDMSEDVKRSLQIIARDYGTGDLADIMRARKTSLRRAENAIQRAAFEMSVPLLLGTYSNSNARHNREAFDRQIFTDNPTGTMVEYYRDISYGQFELSGNTYGWYKTPQSQTFYTSNDGLQGGGARFTLDLVKAADADVDFSQYDSDNDGYVDVVMIVHTGAGAETGANNIWSHRWSLQAARNSYPSIMPQGEYTTNDPRPGFPGQFIKVNDYIIQPELSNASNNNIIEIGVFCHEFGHALGLPDLYDTDYSSAGIGRWGLMSGGSYGGDGRHSETPVHMSAWCKVELGWVEPQVINEAQPKLDILSSTENANQIYKVLMNGANGPEYFLLENRQKVGYDKYLPESGLLVWHIDENKLNSWGPNRNENHKGVDLEEADGRNDLDLNRNQGDSGDPFPGATNNRLFNSSSNPNSQTYWNEDSGVAFRIDDVVDQIVSVAFLLTPELLVTPAERFVAFDAGVVEFEVSNIGGGAMNWSASTTEPWLTVENGDGLNHGSFRVSFDENTGVESRTGFVTISDSESEEQISITQSAAGEWRISITVQDYGGDSTELQCGQLSTATDAIDQNLGESPLPAPIPGVFDARFILPENAYSSFDFRTPQQNFIEWRIAFQPGPSGVPITLTWEPSSLPKGSFYIQDEITGTLINNNMAETNELVIPTRSISRVKIIYSSKEPEIVETEPGWNLVSVPVLADDMSPQTLFPSATSRAFVFSDSGYTTTDDLQTGRAYWLKFENNDKVPIFGASIDSTIRLHHGWNLIGPFDNAVPVSSIITTPTEIIASDFLAFDEKYSPAETLEPGTGYWVLATADGLLSLSGNMPTLASATHTNNNITSFQKVNVDEAAIEIPLHISDATGQKRMLMLGLNPRATSAIDNLLAEEELPPMPPARVFDARFTTANLSGVALGEGSYRDMRRGDDNFEGTIDYEIRFQSTDNSKITIAWNLPPNVTGTVSDYLNSHIINKEISGHGELGVSLVNVIDRLKFSLNFKARPSITVTSPNGGETLRIGSETMLTWDSKNVQEDVTVELSRDNANTFETLATIANSGSYTWTVTRPAADNCFLRVATADGAILDASDAGFRIDFVDGVQHDALPSECALEQNYPNPFNPSTTISYQLPAHSDVHLVVINSLGQVIRTLTHGSKNAGAHSVIWDGRDENGQAVSSGLYFYQIKAGDFQQTRKMILMQ